MSLESVVEHSGAVLRFIEPLTQSAKWRELEKKHPFTKANAVTEARSTNAIVYSRGTHRFIVKAVNENTLAWNGKEEQGKVIPASSIQNTLKAFFTSLSDLSRMTLAVAVLGSEELTALANKDIALETQYNVSSIFGIAKSRNLQAVHSDIYCPTPAVLQFNEIVFQFAWANGDSWEKENSLSETSLLVSAYHAGAAVSGSCGWVNKTVDAIALKKAPQWWADSAIWQVLLGVAKRFASPSFTIRNPFESINHFESSIAVEKVAMILQLLWRKGNDSVVSALAEVLECGLQGLAKPLQLPETEGSTSLWGEIYDASGFDTARYTPFSSLVLFNNGTLVVRDGDNWTVLPLHQIENGAYAIVWDVSKWRFSRKDTTHNILPLSVSGALKALGGYTSRPGVVCVGALKEALSKLEDKELKEIYARLFTELDSVKGAARQDYEGDVLAFSFDESRLTSNIDWSGEDSSRLTGLALQLARAADAVFQKDKASTEEAAKKEEEEAKNAKTEEAAAAEVDDELQKKDPLAAIMKRKEKQGTGEAPKDLLIAYNYDKKHKSLRVFPFAEKIRQRAVAYSVRGLLKSACNVNSLTEASEWLPQCLVALKDFPDKGLEDDIDNMAKGAEEPAIQLTGKEHLFTAILLSLAYKTSPTDAVIQAVVSVATLGADAAKNATSARLPHVFKRVTTALQAVKWNRLCSAFCIHAITLFPESTAVIFPLGLRAAKVTEPDNELTANASPLLEEFLKVPQTNSGSDDMDVDESAIIRCSPQELSTTEEELNTLIQSVLDVIPSTEQTVQEAHVVEYCELAARLAIATTAAQIALIDLLVQQAQFNTLLTVGLKQKDDSLLKSVLESVRSALGYSGPAAAATWGILKSFILNTLPTLPTERLLPLTQLLRSQTKRPQPAPTNSKPSKAPKLEPVSSKVAIPTSLPAVETGTKALNTLASVCGVEYLRRLPHRKGEKLDVIRLSSSGLSDGPFSALVNEALLLYLIKECQRSEGVDIARDVSEWLVLKFAAPKFRTDKAFWARVIGVLKEYVAVIPVSSTFSAIGDSVGLFKDAADLILTRYKKSFDSLDGAQLKIMTRSGIFNALKSSDTDFLFKVVQDIKKITNESLREVAQRAASSLASPTSVEACQELATRLGKTKGLLYGIDEGPGTERLTLEQKALVRKAVFLTTPSLIGPADVLVTFGEALVDAVAEKFTSADQDLYSTLQTGLSERLKWAATFAAHEKGDCEIIVRAFKRLAARLSPDLISTWEKAEETK